MFAARSIMLDRTGPTHGVHPMAKKNPSERIEKKLFLLE